MSLMNSPLTVSRPHRERSKNLFVRIENLFVKIENLFVKIGLGFVITQLRGQIERTSKESITPSRMGETNKQITTEKETTKTTTITIERNILAMLVGHSATATPYGALCLIEDERHLLVIPFDDTFPLIIFDYAVVHDHYTKQ